MLLLASTSDLLRIVTSAARTIDVHASFVDSAAAGITPGRTNTAITTSTTTTVVASPAAATLRNVKTLSIRNKEALNPCDITVLHTDGTTIIEIYKCTLLAGRTLQYFDDVGFVILDQTAADVFQSMALRIDTAQGNTEAEARQARQNAYLHAAPASVAAATTIDLSATTSDLVEITGNSNLDITAITLPEGDERTLRFQGINRLFSGSTLVIPGASRVRTRAGDTMRVRGYAAGIVRVMNYQRLDKPYFQGRRTSNQSLPHNVLTIVQLDTEDFDSNAAFVVANPWRFTPLVPGLWWIFGTVRYEGIAGRSYVVQSAIRKSAATVLLAEASFLAPTGANTQVPVAGFVYFDGVDDFIDLCGYEYDFSTLNSINMSAATLAGFHIADTE